jgi:hypothetical protein
MIPAATDPLTMPTNDPPVTVRPEAREAKNCQTAKTITNAIDIAIGTEWIFSFLASNTYRLAHSFAFFKYATATILVDLVAAVAPNDELCLKPMHH